MKRFRKAMTTALVVVEGVLSLPVFLLAWWGSSLYRSVVVGWQVSGMEAAEKRAALAKLIGEDDHAG